MSAGASEDPGVHAAIAAIGRGEIVIEVDDEIVVARVPRPLGGAGASSP